MFSTDPLKETLSEIGLFLGIMAVIVIGFVWWRMRRDANQNGEKGQNVEKSKKSKKGKKGEKGKRGNAVWWAVAILIFVMANVFTQVYMRNIRAVKDVDIQKQYSGMYDYEHRVWTSGGYTGLFYVTYAVTVPFSIFLRGPIIAP